MVLQDDFGQVTLIEQSGNHEKEKIISLPILPLMASSECKYQFEGDLEVVDVDF